MFKKKSVITTILIVIFSTVFLTGCYTDAADNSVDTDDSLQDLREGEIYSEEKHQKKFVSKKHKAAVKKMMARLGLNKYVKTDPEMLNSILYQDMFLGDLDSVHELLGDKLQKPYPLKPMIKTISNSIITKHPAIVEFIAAAIKEDLIPKVKDDESKEIIKRMIHHTYLLEIINVEMVRNVDFMIEVGDHLLAKREAFGLSSDFMTFVLSLYHVSGELFEPIKTKTMDWVTVQYENMRLRGAVLPHEESSRIAGLKLNIMEAVVTENAHGYSDNAMAGVALAINPPEAIQIVGEDTFIEYIYPQEWVSLYETWNMAFITGNVDYLNILFPKLLIPSVIAADSNDYLFNRALSLWTSINFFLFAQITNKPVYEIPNKEELASLWGEINHKYAKEYVQKQNGTELNNFSYLLGTTMQNIWDNLKMFLVGYGLITAEDAELLSGMLFGN